MDKLRKEKEQKEQAFLRCVVLDRKGSNFPSVFAMVVPPNVVLSAV